jgi:hypothetical protein
MPARRWISLIVIAAALAVAACAGPAHMYDGPALSASETAIVKGAVGYYVLAASRVIIVAVDGKPVKGGAWSFLPARTCSQQHTTAWLA